MVMRSNFSDPSSDAGATNPLHDNDKGACIIANSPGHAYNPLAHTSVSEYDAAVNALEQ